jgi:fumarate reductase subunit D
MKKRALEPVLWPRSVRAACCRHFSSRSLLFLFGLAFPLGWLASPDRAQGIAVLGHPLARLGSVALCTLSLFRWAHRSRYTLYDGLQIKHLNELINLFCYGGAILGSVLAAYLAVSIP